MRRRRIVTIGGGTGSFTLLSGLRKHSVDLSAIVSMADDGGSTGVLRDELGVLPPGDVRQCLVALSESSEEMRALMNYRFEKGALEGHNFGNLFLSALEKTHGDFGNGVDAAMRILNVQGEVIPVTTQEARLLMKLKDGKVLTGENDINHSDLQSVGIEKFWYDTKVGANPLAVKRIKKADMIVIGPGNHFCSILPNVLVRGISNAIKESKAKVVYVSNLANKRVHTSGWSVDDYISSLEQYIGKGRVNLAIFHDKKIPENLLKKYKRQEGAGAVVNLGNREKRSYSCVLADVLSAQKVAYATSDVLSATRSFIRHDSDKLAQVILYILDLDSQRRLIRKII